VLDELSKQN